MFGRHVIDQILNTDIDILYGIDTNAERKKERFPIYGIDDDLPKVDVVVVTVTYDEKKISDLLKEKGITKSMTIKEVINSIVERI